MKPIFKPLIASIVGLMMCACSQNGAEAQSADPVVESQIQSDWTVDKDKSRLGFSGSQSGDIFSGEFKSFTATIKFDPDALEAAKVDVSIDMTSVDAGDSERNDALPGKEWFFVKTFPNARYTSQSFEKTGDDQYVTNGELTIRDTTLPISLPFSLKIENGTAKMTGSVSINRTDFSVGTGMWSKEDWVAHDVKINVELQATKSENE